MASRTLTFSGGTATANWSTAGWDTTPVAGDTAVIRNTGGSTGTLTLDINTPTLGALSIGASGNKSVVLAVGTHTLAIDNAGTASTDLITVGSLGEITLAGGTIDAGGISLTANGTLTASLSGYGTVSILSTTGSTTHTIRGTGTITATGGTLELDGTVTSGPAFTIGTASSSTLLFNGSATAASAIAINNTNQTLEVGSTGTLTISATENITNGTIWMNGGKLADSNGVTLGASSVLIGWGAVTAPLAAGTGTVTASGGTLTLSGAVSSGDTLAIDSTKASELLITGTATAASAIGITSSNQTLAIGPTGSLTISNVAESITAGTVSLAGGTLIDYSGITLGAGAQLTGYGTVNGTLTAAGLVSVSGGTLTDGSGIVLTGGTLTGTGTLAANTNVTGSGTISLPVSTTGTVTASGGTLDITGTTSNRTLVINDATASVLQIDAAVSSPAAIGIYNTAQTLAIGSAGTLTLGAAESINYGTILLNGGSLADSAGISIGSGATFSGYGTVSGALTGAYSGTVTVSGGTLTDASGIVLAGGTLNGSGNLAANTNVSGYGTISLPVTTAGTFTASSGTLDLTGASSNRTLAIGTSSMLKIDAATTASGAIAINSSTQALVIGSAGTLTLGAAESITNGTITLNGGSLADSAGITLGASAQLTGYGTVSANIAAGTGTITANGGILALDGNAASGVAYVIASTAGSTLQFDGTATAASAIALNNTAQTLEVGATGNLTIVGTQTMYAGNFVMAGGTLTDTSGLAVDGGTLIGYGTVAAGLGVGSSSGTITASGGILALTGSIPTTNTNVFTIGTASPSTLLFSNASTATSATAIAISNANQTLEVGNATTLALGAAESITNGTIALAGGALADTKGVTLGAGSSLTGYGTVSATLSGTGTVTASGGTLTLSANIAASSGLVFDIANSSTSVLKLSGTVGSGNTVTFAGTQGALELNDVTVTAGGLNFSGTVDNLGTASVDSSVSGINYIDVQGTVTNVVFVDSTHIAVYDGTVDLGTITLGSAVNTSTTHVDWIADSTLGGTDIFLSTVNCFAAGTLIRTPAGERTVESLAAGEEVLTLSDQDQIARPIHWVGHRHIDLTAHPEPRLVAPVRVRQGAFAENTPSADLLLSPDHAVLVDGRLIAIRQLINGATIRQETDWAAVDYYHLELDRHAILITEGMPTESYLDTGNRGFFANSGEPMALHPDLMDESDNAPRASLACVPFAWDEATVRPIWQGLAERAVALGEALPKIETTTEADLHLLIKGRSQRPLYAENGLYIFALRRGVTEARLASRAGVPSDARPWLDDRRTLGVAVERIVLRTAEDVRDIPLDDPRLTQGWWGVESDGTAMRRWTDGNAVLPLPGAAGPTILEVRVRGTIPYRIGADRERQIA